MRDKSYELYFSWFQEVGGHLQPVYSSARFEPLQDVLLIRKVRLEDNGRWTCKVSNHFGEQRIDIHLTVTAHLTVHVVSEHKVRSIASLNPVPLHGEIFRL